MAQGEEKAKRRWWLPWFSVRTLMILVTLLSITLARISYLRRMSQLHKDIADGFVGQICDYRQNPRDAVEYMIKCDSSNDRAFKWSASTMAFGPLKSDVSQMTKGPIKVMWHDKIR